MRRSIVVSCVDITRIYSGGPFYDMTVFSLFVYRRAFENRQYAYGAALSLILIVVGVIAALGMWRLIDMRRVLEPPRMWGHWCAAHGPPQAPPTPPGSQATQRPPGRLEQVRRRA